MVDYPAGKHHLGKDTEKMKVIVVGGGWSGCAAALQARKMGAEVTLLERTDMLLGTGLVGGIMRNNGRFTATEELIALGGGEIFQAVDGNYLHHDIEFPGHRHASLYNVARMEPIIKKLLTDRGVTLRLESRIVDVEMDGRTIAAVSRQGQAGRGRFQAGWRCLHRHDGDGRAAGQLQ